VQPIGASIHDEDWPTVDIFVLVSRQNQAPKATYSLAAAAQLDYPKDCVRLHLVGTGDAAEAAPGLIALAQRMKASWLAASPEVTPGHALSASLARTAGDLVLVLNAGEAPTGDLLRRLAADFVADPRLAYIDVPIFAIDGDPVLADIDVMRRVPGDPGHFFKTCLKAIGAFGGSFGTTRRTLWQRAALTACGSFSRWGLSADAMTRMRAAETGWRHAATKRPMIAALAPETVRDYLAQRLTQRAGMIEAALTRDPLTTRGLSLRERLSWLPALFAAGLPLAWLLMLALPPLALLLQVPLTSGAGALEAAAMTIVGLLVALSLAGALHAGLGSGFIAMWSELLESLLSLPAVVALLAGRRDALPSKLDADHASSVLIVLFAVALAGTTAGIAAWIMKPEAHTQSAPLLAATILAACICALLLGAISEVRQRRLSPRVARHFDAELLLGGQRFEGRLADISVHGARFVADGLVDMPARALAGKLSLAAEHGIAELPVQLSRLAEEDGCSTFGLSFTGRTVGEFATVVRLAHRSNARFADICDARARQTGAVRLVGLLTFRGLGDLVRRLWPRRSIQRLAPAPARKRSG
jgi:cellulose synthase (UDP-forming)